MKACPVCGKEYSDTTTLCPIDAAVLERKDDPLVGQTLAGKYSIEKLIKRGGMGSVYVGKHVLMDKTVAIKVLRPSLAVDNDVVARFSREAKAASRISHPHAVSVTDFGEDEHGVVFLVMEYLDGRTLKEAIKMDGPMAMDRVVEIVRQVSGALDVAHQQGVVHRDLKSDNIMLVRHDGAEWAKVLDFGIAKIQQPEGARDIDITAANLVIGTPQYMSPEQCSQSGPIDARSDVYSLGIIIFEMLAGHVPFTGESPTVIMMKQVQDAPPSIRDARPQLPVAIETVIDRALAKKPADRFASAGELSHALTNAATGLTETSVMTAAPVTIPNAPVALPADDDEVTVVHAAAVPPPAVDEVTVVRPRRTEVPLHAPPAAPSALAGMNPWRIMIPGLIALVAVFGLVFFLTRGTTQTPADNSNVTPTGLLQDPNSQPVQPAGTPTGDTERDIRAQPSMSSTPRPASANANTGQEIPSTTVIGNFGANENSNQSNSNRTANKRESPTPQSSPVEEAPPPPKPKPSATVRSVPKPVASPTGNP
jgi:serine/threonine-protein kinase